MSAEDSPDRRGQGDGPTPPTEDLTEPNDVAVLAGDPDQTWRVLGLVNDWVKHAETKAAATLTVAGVCAGVLYNLVRSLNKPGTVVDVAAILCAVCIVSGALAAAWALRPRLSASDEPTSNLYFHHIARKHPKRTGGSDYVPALTALTLDHAALAAEIASQVWSNAHVARSKFRAANVGLALILVGIVLLGATAAAVAWKTW